MRFLNGLVNKLSKNFFIYITFFGLDAKEETILNIINSREINCIYRD